MTEWRAIPGYAGLYEASTDGRIRSFVRYVNGRILKPQQCGKYLTVDLWRNRHGRQHYVHALVLLAFTGERPRGKQACHHDGDTTNNCVKNLRWDTAINNNKDKQRHGTIVPHKHISRAKLTESQVRSIRSAYDQGVRPSTLVQQYALGWATILNVCKRQSWRHVV